MKLNRKNKEQRSTRYNVEIGIPILDVVPCTLSFVLRWTFLIFLFSCFFIFTSCGPRENAFRIEGKLKGLQGGELYIYNLDQYNARFDTIQLKEGKFTYNSQCDRTSPFVLVYPNGTEHVIFVSPASAIEYEATASNLSNYSVKGTDENKLLNEFRNSIVKNNDDKVQDIARQFILSHKDSPVAVYLFQRFFLQNEKVEEAEIRSILKELRAVQPGDHNLLEAEGSLKIVSQGRVGTKLPAITLNTKQGKNIELNKPQKQYTLVAFWASWMPNQWQFTSRLRGIARKENRFDSPARADLQVISVSLDTEIYKWEGFLSEDSTVINHVCDGLAFDSPPVSKLGVRKLPAYVLADKNAKIIARGFSVEQMENDVDKFCK